MRSSFFRADFDALAGLWNTFYPAKYRVAPGLLRSHTVDSPVFDWGSSCVMGDPDRPSGFAAVKRSSAALWKGPDPDQSHLCAIAFQDPLVGVDMMASVKRILRERGAYRLVFGQDSRHFFPGLPSECGQLREFLTIEGFEPDAEQVDLERDLADYAPPEGVIESLEGATVRPCCEEDLPGLRGFLDRVFPGRWAYDVMVKAGEDGPGTVLGLWFEGDCHGFALIQGEWSRTPIGGAVWNADLGPSWGALGPIGVSPEVRGRGWGHGLLASALLELKARGARRTIIDWTTLADFYSRHGFEVARRYTTLHLSLT
jgi:GNAT superfamily N-acetyltransferase